MRKIKVTETPGASSNTRSGLRTDLANVQQIIIIYLRSRSNFLDIYSVCNVCDSESKETFILLESVSGNI